MISKKLKIVFISLFALNSFACSSSKQSGDVATEQSTSGDDVKATKPGGTNETNNEMLNANLGILNFRQLASTFSERTGVQIDGEVLDEYNSQLSGLNKGNSISVISAASVSAVTKLAAAFCQAMITDPALVGAKLPDVDIAAASVDDTSSLASSLLDSFYGPETILQADRSKDENVLKSYLDNLGGQGLDASAIVFGGCATVLSSGEFYLF